MYIQSQILQMQKQLIWNTQWQQSLHLQGKKIYLLSWSIVNFEVYSRYISYQQHINIWYI